MVNATPGRDAGPDAIVEEIEIAAPPERVFQAITDPMQLRNWWSKEGFSKMDFWEWKPAKGAKYSARWDGAKGEVFSLRGEIVEFDPPRLLTYTWEPSWSKQPTSLVRWELRAAGGGTHVRVTHSGLGGYPDAIKDYRSGWPDAVAGLKAFVERDARVAGPASRHP
jgi:uncharacterized protein YndB with AHSA1/START domain